MTDRHTRENAERFQAAVPDRSAADPAGGGKTVGDRRDGDFGASVAAAAAPGAHVDAGARATFARTDADGMRLRDNGAIDSGALPAPAEVDAVATPGSTATPAPPRASGVTAAAAATPAGRAAQQNAAPHAGPDAAPWPLALRVAFRFACCYLTLYNMVVLANVSASLVPGLSWLIAQYTGLWQRIVPWVGAHVLGLAQPITYFPSGSGDKTSDWVALLCYLALSAAGTLIWSLLDRRRTEYRRLHDALRIVVRYAVGFTMVSYGMAKVIKLQFPDPSLGRLIEPLGEFSPMGLLWTFMGYSKAYGFFGGAAEVTGGVLLFFRRTTLLGALVTGGVMLNVAMMNFSYDVPVKLLASHLCLMCGFLMLPDARRLLRFFVLNQPVAAAPARALFTGRWSARAALAVKVILVGYTCVSSVTESLAARRTYGELAPKPPIYGLYEVEELRRNDVLIPPLLTESQRWRKVIVNSTSNFAVRLMDDTVVNYGATYDAKARTIALASIYSAAPTATSGLAPGQKPPNIVPARLTWAETPDRRLTLSGTILGETYVATLRRIDETTFRLKSRGFHWVSEQPFNR